MLVLSASGCSHLGPAASPTQSGASQSGASGPLQAAPPVPAPRPQHHEAAREPVRHPGHDVPPEPAQLAMIEPQALVGLKPEAVQQRIGRPEAIDKDGLALIWRYTADQCDLSVYFFPDLKTSEFHVLKFSLAGADGKALDPDAPCRRKLLALKDVHAG